MEADGSSERLHFVMQQASKRTLLAHPLLLEATAGRRGVYEIQLHSEDETREWVYMQDRLFGALSFVPDDDASPPAGDLLMRLIIQGRSHIVHFKRWQGIVDTQARIMRSHLNVGCRRSDSKSQRFLLRFACQDLAVLVLDRRLAGGVHIVTALSREDVHAKKQRVIMVSRHYSTYAGTLLLYDPQGPSQSQQLLGSAQSAILRKSLCSVLPAVDFDRCCVVALFVGGANSLDVSHAGNRLMEFAVFNYSFLAEQAEGLGPGPTIVDCGGSVRPGVCWTCEEPHRPKFTCKRCGKATYCSAKCKDRDFAHHVIVCLGLNS